MKKKDNIVRVGDIVKIITPEFFVSCGYPLTYQDACVTMKEKYEDEIHNFLYKIKFRPAPLSHKLFGIELNISGNKQDDYTVGKIINALAYEYVRAEGFGGDEKKIYTIRKEELVRKEFLVTDKKVRNTGTYYPSSGGFDSWSGEYDYECGGLANNKSHIILSLCEFCISNNGEIYPYTHCKEDELKIERIHVEKVYAEENS